MKKLGFTLVELLVVVAIIALLVAMLILLGLMRILANPMAEWFDYNRP